jgi:nucleotide-binding universal stress UspA family protein
VKRLLVALDGSPRQTLVLRVARDLARATSSQLTLFRAVGLPVELPAEVLGLSPDDVQRRLGDLARDELVSLARDLPREISTDVKVEVGTPWRAICEAAKACEADLVVIGSHGHGAIERLLGTTAAKVVDHADRSVLVVR